MEVAKDKAKTASRRLVPVLPALSAWLLPFRRPTGPVVPFANVPKQLGWLARDASVECIAERHARDGGRERDHAHPSRGAVQRAFDLPINAGLKLEADLSTLSFQTKDAEEGAAAFEAKRKPRFIDA